MAPRRQYFLPLELTTTSNDPITAIVNQVAAHAGQLTQLGNREADHHAAPSERPIEPTGQANDVNMSPALGTRYSNGPSALPSPRTPRPSCGITSVENTA
jgi:hypothetical protein